MKRIALLFTGFLLLAGSVVSPVLPTNIVAQSSVPASPERAEAAEPTKEASTPRSPVKRTYANASLARRAVRAVRRQNSMLAAASAADTQNPSGDLLPVVNQEDISMHHRIIANEVLKSLPSQCRDTLKTLYVRYDKPKHRGLAGSTSIILDGTVPDDEFKALLIHEFGHIADLGCLRGNKEAAESEFKDGSMPIYNNDPSVSFYRISWLSSEKKTPRSKREDFVSGYAAWDPFEDFAESFAYFMLQYDAFQRRAQENEVMAAKFRWMQRYLFFDTAQVAVGEHEWTGDVPWDVTKLTYQWNN